MKNVVTVVTERIGELEKRVTELEGELRQKSRAADDEDVRKIKSDLNNYGQYTKKDLGRMFGVAEQKQEDCRKVVSDIIKSRLNIRLEPSDISVAHRVRKSKRQEHRPIIIRFKDRTQKYNIMKARRGLKGSGISLAEEMTRDNIDLVRRAEDSGIFGSVWFWNGKVCARNKTNKKIIHTLNMFDKFEEVVRNTTDKTEEDVEN